MGEVPSEISDFIFEDSPGDDDNNVYDIKFRLIGSKKYNHSLSSPFLLIARSSSAGTHDLFSLGDHNRTFPIVIPELHRSLYCFGSSYGWLFTADLISKEIGLLNPMTRATISLPRLDFYWRWAYEFKATITADPIKGRKGFIAMLITGGVVSFCRPGDVKWSTLIQGFRFRFEDVIGHMGKFYAVDRKGGIVCWDKCGTNAPFKTIIKSSKQDISQRQFLVNSRGGEQLMLIKHNYWKKSMVFKVDTERKCLNRLERLDGDEALFLSQHSSICASTLGYSQYYSANRIYMTDRSDRGVVEYNLEDGSMKTIYSRTGTSHSISNAFWVTPTPKKSLHIITKTKETAQSSEDPPPMPPVINSNVRKGRKN